jgi:hypothetical protein
VVFRKKRRALDSIDRECCLLAAFRAAVSEPRDPSDPASTDEQVAGRHEQESRISLGFGLRAVPEPGSALLISVGLAGLALAGRRGGAAGSSRARHRYQHATVR